MEPKNVTVIGLQWGDEGKGKIVDALAEGCDYVVRYCGGANAGHTVVAGGQKFALHLIPCGILHPGVMNVIGNGVAFDPAVAVQEMTQLVSRGIKVGPGNLCISAAANVVMSYHKLQDSLSEQQLGASRIGTTARGIGPCYCDKANRSTAIRVADLIDPQRLEQRLSQILPVKSAILSAMHKAPQLDGGQIIEEYTELGRQLAPMVCNSGAVLRGAIAEGKRVLFEGGQGSMLDIDHGTFPFVTSSSVSACGVPTGAGVPPKAIGLVLGLVKAYSTRVGGGPFPTEQDNEIGSTIRERGHEYGTTTGRPRRCGWFDAWAVRYAAELSGVDEVALSLLDVLSGLKEINVCTGYSRGGKKLTDYDAADLEGVEPVYETLEGWTQDIAACRKFEELPPAARKYVSRVEALIGRPVGFISVGPDRTQTIAYKTKLKELF